MKLLQILGLVLVMMTVAIQAQGPQSKSLGFGLVVGEPYGGTLKYWNGSTTAYAFSIGGSYYGALRVGADYLWHYDSFRSRQFNLYVGPGVVLGFGAYRDGWWYKHDRWVRGDGSLGVAVRGVLGVDFVPRNSPIELFLEAGPMVNLTQSVFTTMDVAIGIRVYP